VEKSRTAQQEMPHHSQLRTAACLLAPLILSPTRTDCWGRYLVGE
jgi:hypothetical protein